MTNDELKSCPFCGTAPETNLHDDGSSYAILCINDDCSCPPHTSYEYDLNIAIKAWNTRAPEWQPEAARELLELRELLKPLVEARDKATQGEWEKHWPEDNYTSNKGVVCTEDGVIVCFSDGAASFVTQAANILSQPALRRLLGEGE